jgi:hypothetical protein
VSHQNNSTGLILNEISAYQKSRLKTLSSRRDPIPGIAIINVSIDTIGSRRMIL